jgi:hypothetical protein
MFRHPFIGFKQRKKEASFPIVTRETPLSSLFLFNNRTVRKTGIDSSKRQIAFFFASQDHAL